MKSIFVQFEKSPDGPRDVWLECDTYIVAEGFGTHASTYPVTICKARYNGTYEGAPWLAFPVAPHILSRDEWQDWNGSDIECTEWHTAAAEEGWPIGRGHAPDLAYRNLLEVAAAGAGINLADLDAEPTWDKEELGRRNDDAG